MERGLFGHDPQDAPRQNRPFVKSRQPPDKDVPLDRFRGVVVAALVVDTRLHHIMSVALLVWKVNARLHGPFETKA